MGLSQDNINKLCMTGVYRCNPVLKWLPSYKRDNPYHCVNWIFTPDKYKDNYYMMDTYWLSDRFSILLSDENFDMFELLFDKTEVEKFSGDYAHWIEYDESDRWSVAMDSGGINYPKRFIRKGTVPDKDKVVERLKNEITYLKNEIAYKQRTLDDVINDRINLRYT